MAGRLIRFTVFNDADRAAAQDTRLELELDLVRKNLNHEAILLEAANEEDLRRTHRRYSESMKELTEPASSN